MNELPRQGRRATSADVARAAGVSRATVSYVLNNSEGQSISAATAAKVRAAAHDMNYAPSASARALRSGHSGVVLLLLNDWDIGPTYPQIFARLSAQLTQSGYMLLMRSLDDEPASLRELLRFVTPTLVMTLAQLPKEQVAFLRAAGVTLATVDLDTLLRECGRRQAEHLIARGHRRLGYLVPAHHVPAEMTEPRWAGVQRACADAGAEPPVMAPMEYSDGGVARLERDWFDGPARVTGVCAHTDEVGAFVIAKIPDLRERGIAVIGMSDRPIAHIGLTTVAVDIETWSDLFAEAAYAALEGRAPTEITARTTRVVVRQSA